MLGMLAGSKVDCIAAAKHLCWLQGHLIGARLLPHCKSRITPVQHMLLSMC